MIGVHLFLYAAWKGRGGGAAPIVGSFGVQAVQQQVVQPAGWPILPLYGVQRTKIKALCVRGGV